MQDFGREGAERAERWVGKMTNSLFTSYNSNFKKTAITQKGKICMHSFGGVAFLIFNNNFYYI